MGRSSAILIVVKVELQHWACMVGVAIGLTAMAVSAWYACEGHPILAVILVGVMPLTGRRASPRSIEETSFEEFRQACLEGDPLAALAAHTRWLSCLEVDAEALELICDPFPEWVDMQLAVESPECCWRGEDLLNVVEHQRSAHVSDFSC